MACSGTRATTLPRSATFSRSMSGVISGRSRLAAALFTDHDLYSTSDSRLLRISLSYLDLQKLYSGGAVSHIFWIPCRMVISAFISLSLPQNKTLVPGEAPKRFAHDCTTRIGLCSRSRCAHCCHVQRLCGALPDDPAAIGQLDPDTALSRRTWQAATAGVGACCRSIDRIMSGQVRPLQLCTAYSASPSCRHKVPVPCGEGMHR